MILYALSNISSTCSSLYSCYYITKNRKQKLNVFFFILNSSYILIDRQTVNYLFILRRKITNSNRDMFFKSIFTQNMPHQQCKCLSNRLNAEHPYRIKEKFSSKCISRLFRYMHHSGNLPVLIYYTHYRHLANQFVDHHDNRSLFSPVLIDNYELCSCA